MKTYTAIWAQWQQASANQDDIDAYLKEHPEMMGEPLEKIVREIAVDTGYKDLGFEQEDKCVMLNIEE